MDSFPVNPYNLVFQVDMTVYTILKDRHYKEMEGIVGQLQAWVSASSIAQTVNIVLVDSCTM